MIPKKTYDQKHETGSTNSCKLLNTSVWQNHQHNIHEDRQDHFIYQDGEVFAGNHLIIDLWQAHHLDDLQYMESVMRKAIEESKATLLHIHLHHFSPNGGISGVAVLAESHISVHTWPEKGYAAFDVFMCGDAQPEKAVEVLKTLLRPEKCSIHNIKRGQVK